MNERIFRTLSLCILAIGVSGCISLDLSSFVSPSLQEHEISRDSSFTRNKILIIDISGLIRSRESGAPYSRYTTPDSIKSILNKAASDEDIKAVVLRINSPGGEVTATDTIHHDIMTFKEQTGIPIQAAIMSFGTSGAYYIAVAADKIYGHPTSITGSIGVIARVPQFSELAEKIGYSEIIFKTGKNKGIGHPLKEMNKEQRSIFQKMVDSMFERFLEVVVEGRPAYESRDQLRQIADGRIYTTEEALRIELVDGIAYLDDVIAKAKESAGLEHARVITYNHRGDYDSNIYSKVPTQVNLFNIDLSDVLSHSQAGFHYLWMPTD